MPTAPLPHRIARILAEQELCRPGDTLIVAVSGGADSVALLDLLATAPHLELRLVVAHLNHLLRGRESDEDERFVRTLAERYGLPCLVRRLDVRAFARQRALSLEEAGRQARYAYFEELQRQYGAAAVAVAHHADDQAETLLLRLLRGAGTTGLSAMPPSNGRGIIRPLLALTRDTLRAHLADRCLPFREDASNQDRSFLRNRIRHELLPLLATYNPAIATRLAATADLLGEEAQLLGQITHTAWLQLATAGDGWVALSKAPLQGQTPALRLRLYRHALTAICGDLRRFERAHYLSVDRLLLREQTGNRANLPRGVIAFLTDDRLCLSRRELLTPRHPRALTINGPGCFDLGNGLQVAVEETAPPVSWHQLPPQVCYIDPRQAPFPWQLRPAQPADRIAPLGMTGSQTVRDILVDAKLPRHLRPYLPLLVQQDCPLWLPLLRRSRHALLDAGAGRCIRVTLLGADRLPCA